MNGSTEVPADVVAGPPVPTPAPLLPFPMTAFHSPDTLPVPSPTVAEESSEPPPPKPEDPVVELVRCYREKRTAEVTALLQQFDPSRREILQAMLPNLSKLADKRNDPPGPKDWATLLDQQDQLGVKLCSRAALTLDRVSFCRSIDGFGLYEPLAADHRFQAGSPGQSGELVQVYLELRHFACQLKGPFYETVLASTLEIRDGKRQVVWRFDRPAKPSRSRTPRQDCFLNCHFEVPAIPPGDYVLCIQVKDLTGINNNDPPPHRIATRTLDFRVSPTMQPRAER